MNSSSQLAQAPKKGTFSFWKVLAPVVLGLGVVGYMFWKDASRENLLQVLGEIEFSFQTWIWVAAALFFTFWREFGYAWRFRALTGNQLKWRSAFEVDMLCEFTSCITPSAVGGSSVGMIFLNSKGIEFGRATTLMITTLFLDELFFVVFCPIVVLLTPAGEIFASGASLFSSGVRLTFWLIYGGIVLWTIILFFGIILRPHWIKSLIVKVFRWRLLSRWREQAEALGDDMVATSRSLRDKPFKFWLEVFGGTTLSWFSRFIVVNALFMAFIPSAEPWQWVIFARQFVIWVILMICPTPGGAGLSEWLFSEYYGDIVTSSAMVLVMAVFWRVVTYYIYLLIGAMIVPGWLKSSYHHYHDKNSDNKDSSTKTGSESDGDGAS